MRRVTKKSASSQTTKGAPDMGRRNFLLAAGAVATTGLLMSSSGRAGEPTRGGGGEPPAKSDKPKIGLEQRLAQFAAGVRYDSLPGQTVQATKRLLLDALACAFGAVGCEPSKIAEATFRKAFGAGGGSSIIGSSSLIASEGAALVNGILVRYFDLNDVYFGNDPSHPSEVIPGALAACEEAGRSGRDLIEAVVVAYEAEVRLNNAIAWASRGLHSLTCGSFAIPLAVGKAWRMPVLQVANAVGISGARQLTTLAMNRGEISMMKALAPGHTAMDAIFATRLAAAGFTGPLNGLEWMAANVQPAQKNINVDLNPDRYLLTKVGLKRFPLQGELQAVTEAAVNASPKVKGHIDDIREIVAEVYPQTIDRGVAEPEKYRPTTRETADHSLPVCVAMGLIDGDVSVRQFHDDRWKAAEVLGLASKVKVRVSETLKAKMPKGHGSSVEVHLSNGQVVRETVEIPEGDPERPMSPSALDHKFHQFADPVLGEAGAKKLISLVNSVEDVKDVRALTEVMRRRG